MKVTFVYSNDYVAAYIDGQLACDGDEINYEELIEAIAERAGIHIEVASGDVDDALLEEIGDFPEDLEDLGEIR